MCLDFFNNVWDQVMSDFLDADTLKKMRKVSRRGVTLCREQAPLLLPLKAHILMEIGHGAPCQEG